MSNQADANASEGGANLPDILGNLRIVPTIVTPSLNCRPFTAANPFGTLDAVVLPENNEMQQYIDRMFGAKCNCLTSKLSPSSSKDKSRHLQSTILHQKQFKQRRRSDLKLLKEPTLRLVEQCLVHLHHGHHGPQTRASHTSVEPQSATRSENPSGAADKCIGAFSEWNVEGTVNDFKALVRNCESLSLSSTSIPDLHKSRSFRTHQTKPLAQAILARRQSLRMPITSESSTASVHNQQQQQMAADTSNLITGQQRPTCSQQALMNQAESDVTIDELACYFETFVHIPKKMSSMAEMMYI